MSMFSRVAVLNMNVLLPTKDPRRILEERKKSKMKDLNFLKLPVLQKYIGLGDTCYKLLLWELKETKDFCQKKKNNVKK